MMARQRLLALLVALNLLASTELPAARAFIINPNLNPWLTTASGTRTGRGEPVTLTWSFVSEGTTVGNGSGGTLGGSNLIAFLDLEFGGDPNDSDLTHRPWFQIFSDAFGRWSELSGATYVYEPHDDGVTHPSENGVLGVRGDLRIAGATIDGPGNVLAFNYLPNDGGDMVLDTADGVLFKNPDNGFRYLRNTIMHEHGHGFGLQHVNSGTDNLLMEPSIDVSIDGPQLDEVRAIQYYFGDANEKSNGGLGNGTAALATSLGPIASGGSVSVGSDADVPDQFIESTAIDFVSIANLNDVDFFSFEVSQRSKLTAVLTPRGGQFTQSGQGGTPTLFDASARSDLSLAIFDVDGTSLLQLANDTGLGGVESIMDLELPTAGQYYARVTGAQDTIQLYELELSTLFLYEADFDEDGDVDATDLGIWETAYGTTALGDANSDGVSDGSDFLVWQQQYTGELTPPLAASQAVPEPGAAVLLIAAAVALSGRKILR